MAAGAKGVLMQKRSRNSRGSIITPMKINQIFSNCAKTSFWRGAVVNRKAYAVRTTATLAVALAVSASGLSGCSSRTAAPEVGYVLLDGSQSSMRDQKGKVTWVNFWATSCVTCLAEMPKIIATHEKYRKRGYDTVAIAMRYDPPSYVINYAQTRKLPFKVVIDNTGLVAKSWGGVTLTPTSFLVNQRGEIVKRYEGEPDFAELHLLIEKLLSES